MISTDLMVSPLPGTAKMPNDAPQSATAAQHAALVRRALQRSVEAAGFRRLAEAAEAEAQRLADRAAALAAAWE